MSKWLLRGLVFAAVMVIVRLLQGAMINLWESWAATINIVLVSVYALVAFAWGLVDGRQDARRNPDPDRRSALAMTWLLTGLFAGIVSGFVAWLIGIFYDDLYVEALRNEITTVAAFTALLTFVLAVIGVALGRWLVDRRASDLPHRRQGEDDDRADTDVFAAVRPGGHDDSTTTHDQTTGHQTMPVTPQGGGTERTTPPENRL